MREKFTVPSLRCPNPDCGEPVLDTDRFCEVCGHAIHPAPQPVPDVTLLPLASHEAAPAGHNGDGTRTDLRTRRAPRAQDHVEVSLLGVAAVSDRGLERVRNEDAVGVVRVEDAEASILVVCDGVASSEGGAVAARAAAGAAVTSLKQTLRAHPSDLEKGMNEAVAAAQAAVAAIPHEKLGAKDAPSSTLVAAVVEEGAVTIGWVGDSRAYFVGPAGTWQLSRDDTWASDQVALGLLSEVDAASDPRGGFLTRWLGADEGVSVPSVRTFEVEWPGLVLLCSDGLWNYLPGADRLGEMVLRLGENAEPLAVARSLIEFARGAGGHDNITVALATVRAPQPAVPASNSPPATRSTPTIRLLRQGDL
jgi:serine/threonine protein phosphatase PrpC